MSYFSDKSQEAIAALTDDEITRVINLACAEQGIPIFIERPEKPKLEMDMDATLYKVGEWLFYDAKDANQVADAVRKCNRAATNYDYWDSSSRRTYKPCDSDVEVKAEKFFSPEKHHQYKAELTAHARREKDYESAKTEWDAIEKSKAEVIGRVWDEVNDARHAIRERERVIALYEKYVELANGDREVAWNFLKRAERLTPEQVQEMRLHEAIQVGAFDAPDWRPNETMAEDHAAVL
jgi:hypothetical protein